MYESSAVRVQNKILSCFSLSNFAEYPMASLHEGLFLNQTHAESYVSMFTPQLDMLELSNVRRTSGKHFFK